MASKDFRTNVRVAQSSNNLIESLEQRRLFATGPTLAEGSDVFKIASSIGLHNGTLAVRGTDHDDKVAIFLDDNKTLAVKLNGHTVFVALIDIHQIRIETFRGND